MTQAEIKRYNLYILSALAEFINKCPDGITPYLLLKSLERKDTEYSYCYWIENTIKCYL